MLQDVAREGAALQISLHEFKASTSITFHYYVWSFAKTWHDMAKVHHAACSSASFRIKHHRQRVPCVDNGTGLPLLWLKLAIRAAHRLGRI
jgi:hypothetical protein